MRFRRHLGACKTSRITAAPASLEAATANIVNAREAHCGIQAGWLVIRRNLLAGMGRQKSCQAGKEAYLGIFNDASSVEAMKFE